MHWFIVKVKPSVVVPLLFWMLFLDLSHQMIPNFPVAMLIKSGLEQQVPDKKKVSNMLLMFSLTCLTFLGLGEDMLFY
jgi:hypothetical protein